MENPPELLISNNLELSGTSTGARVLVPPVLVPPIECQLMARFLILNYFVICFQDSTFEADGEMVFYRRIMDNLRDLFWTGQDILY